VKFLFSFPENVRHAQFGFAVCFERIELRVGGCIVNEFVPLLDMKNFLNASTLCLATEFLFYVPEYHTVTVKLLLRHEPLFLTCAAFTSGRKNPDSRLVPEVSWLANFPPGFVFISNGCLSKDYLEYYTLREPVCGDALTRTINVNRCCVTRLRQLAVMFLDSAGFPMDDVFDTMQLLVDKHEWRPRVLTSRKSWLYWDKLNFGIPIPDYALFTHTFETPTANIRPPNMSTAFDSHLHDIWLRVALKPNHNVAQVLVCGANINCLKYKAGLMGKFYVA
jgi:hypothetical protein